MLMGEEDWCSQDLAQHSAPEIRPVLMRMDYVEFFAATNLNELKPRE
jgi:hypothetical protein